MKKELTLGEKIRQVRKEKGFSQENMAYAIKTSDAFVGRIERGEAECSEEMLEAIKEFLGIVGAPLLEPEIKVYKSRLWAANEMINASRLSDARVALNDLSAIKHLPFEQDLSIIYSMIEARILFREGNAAAAEELINAAEATIDEAGVSALHMYHRNKGYLYYAQKNDYKKALNHYFLVLELESDEVKYDANVLFTIGSCYNSLFQPFKAISYYEQARREFSGDSVHKLASQIDIELATSYAHTGDLKRAEKLFEASLAHAKSINNENSIGIALMNLAFVKGPKGEYHEVIKYTDQALVYLKNDKYTCAMLLYNKALILINLKEFEQCKKVIEQGKALAQGNETCMILLESANHLITLNDSASANYIETVTIPHLISCGNSGKYAVQHYCNVLEAHYKKKRATKKAMAIAVISRDIYREMIFGTEYFLVI